MRASKEMADEARQALAEIDELVEPLRSSNGVLKLNARGFKQLNNNLAWIGEFLNVAKRKLPTEAAYDRDKKRKRD